MAKHKEILCQMTDGGALPVNCQKSKATTSRHKKIAPPPSIIGRPKNHPQKDSTFFTFILPLPPLSFFPFILLGYF